MEFDLLIGTGKQVTRYGPCSRGALELRQSGLGRCDDFRFVWLVECDYQLWETLASGSWTFFAIFPWQVRKCSGTDSLDLLDAQRHNLLVQVHPCLEPSSRGLRSTGRGASPRRVESLRSSDGLWRILRCGLRLPASAMISWEAPIEMWAMSGFLITAGNLIQDLSHGGPRAAPTRLESHYSKESRPE